MAVVSRCPSHCKTFTALAWWCLPEFPQHVNLVQAYANSKGVKIVGDIPIYVGGQSADVWAYQDLFELGADGQPLIVSGVPPDAFSETGQLWGSPIYDWKVCRCSLADYRR